MTDEPAAAPLLGGVTLLEPPDLRVRVDDHQPGGSPVHRARHTSDPTVHPEHDLSEEPGNAG